MHAREARRVVSCVTRRGNRIELKLSPASGGEGPEVIMVQDGTLPYY